jgi:two-component system, response regulator PdtaR
MADHSEDIAGEVVLLVEDEQILREMATDVLNERGFKVVAVASGEEALQQLILDQVVDVLFTDIHLSGEMDGSMLGQLARQLRPQLPIAYTSGNARPEHIDPVAGSVFVPKPYNPRVIVRMLTSLIERQRGPLAPRPHQAMA